MKLASLIITAIIAFAVGYFLRYVTHRCAPPQAETIVIRDTLPYYKPVPKDSIILRYVTVKLPAKDGKHCKEDSTENEPVIDTENLLCKQEPNPDSAEVLIPITRKVYQDSTYRAVISGYNVILDEMTVFSRREVVTIRPQTNHKRWSVGLQMGYGVVMQDTPKFRPYIGIGLQYRMLGK